MKYKIITTVELEVTDETSLNNMLTTISSFVINNDGKYKHLIRTVEDEETV